MHNRKDQKLPYASIDFRSGADCKTPPRDFHTPGYGSKTAKSQGKGWVGRLAGSVQMTFKTTKLFSKQNDDELYHLQCDSTRKAWDEYGEPERGYITVHKLYEAYNNGSITCMDDFGPTFLWSLKNLIIPDPVVFNAPLIRVIVDCVKNGVIKGESKTFKCKLHVYFTRLVFYLIAFDPIRNVMNVLQNGARIVSNISKIKQYSNTFSTKREREAPSDFSFTLPGLLKDQEHPGYRSIDQPDGIALTLKEYQRQTIAWMEDQESLSNGLNSLFWEKRQWLDSAGKHDVFYYMPSAGELRLEQPPMVWGGLLCEEMGLGKTVEIVSCILNDNKKNFSTDEEKNAYKGWDDTHLHSTATLIIAPLTLISQWKREIEKSIVDKDLLIVHVHDTKLHGKCKPTDESEPDCKSTRCTLGKTGHYYRRLEDIALNADIVLASYKMLKDDKKAFQTVHWRRIVLDEMQEIRSSTTDLARTCKRLVADFRWMVSGTPLYSDLNDLNGELNFLGIIPFSLDDKDDGFWGNRISKPFADKKKESLDLLNVLLDGIMMRHSKSQTFINSGKSILDLPGRTVELVGVDFIDDDAVDNNNSMMMAPSRTFDSGISSSNSSIDYGNVDRNAYYMQNVANLFVVKSLERIAIDFLDTFVGLTANERRQRVNVIVNLLRRSCTSINLINGGAGCRATLTQIDRILRDRFGVEHAFDNDGGGAVAQVIATASDITVVSPQFAMDILMRSRAVTQTRREIQSGMVRQGNTHQGVYERRRVYAMKTILEKTCEAINKCIKFKFQIKQKHWLNRSRWKLAVELITNGFYFYRNSEVPMDVKRKKDSWKKWVAYINEKKKDVNNSSSDLPEGEKKSVSNDKSNRCTDNSTTYNEEDCDSTFIAPPPTCKTILAKAKLWETADLKGKLESTHIPGWRHKKGDKIWHGREQAKELKETVQEGDEDTIKKLFKRLNVAIADNRSQQQIMEHKAALNSVVINYSKKYYSNNINKDAQGDAYQQRDEKQERKNGNTVEDKFIIARSIKSFYEMINKNKKEIDLSGSNRAGNDDEVVAVVDTASTSTTTAITATTYSSSTDTISTNLKTNAKKTILGPVPSFFKFQNCLFRSATKNAPILKTYSAQLKTLIRRLKQDVPRAQNQYDKVRPYLSKMLWAVREGHGAASENSVEQNGFSSLQQIMEGQMPLCSICYTPVVRPTFTRCVHLACAECMCSWLQAAPMLDIDAAQRFRSRQMALSRNAIDVEREKHAPCMLCRQPFSASQLICVDVNLSEDKEKEKKKTKGDSDNDKKKQYRSIVRVHNAPIFTPALAMEDVEAIGVKLFNQANGMQGRVGRFPALSQEFITALYHATGVVPGAKSNIANEKYRSPKVRKLLEILLNAICNGEKVVVFSQHVESVKHIAVVLTQEKIQHTKIIRGDDSNYQSTALDTFTSQPSCSVLLLHAGAAAAGLTLTCAQNVVLLEPFISSGDENQAFARCHRMGQRNQVKCFILYMKDTIEERMLAYRERESQFAKNDKNVSTNYSNSSSTKRSDDGNENDLSVLSDLKKEHISNNKLFYICGLAEGTVADGL
eukprot:g9028.t1